MMLSVRVYEAINEQIEREFDRARYQRRIELAEQNRERVLHTHPGIDEDTCREDLYAAIEVNDALYDLWREIDETIYREFYDREERRRTQLIAEAETVEARQ